MPRLPEDLRAVVSYAQALDNPLPLLQAELQPASACIGQVRVSCLLCWPFESSMQHSQDEADYWTARGPTKRHCDKSTK